MMPVNALRPYFIFTKGTLALPYAQWQAFPLNWILNQFLLSKCDLTVRRAKVSKYNGHHIMCAYHQPGFPLKMGIADSVGNYNATWTGASNRFKVKSSSTVPYKLRIYGICVYLVCGSTKILNLFACKMWVCFLMSLFGNLGGVWLEFIGIVSFWG